jgi:hypothetical protein
MMFLQLANFKTKIKDWAQGGRRMAQGVGCESLKYIFWVSDTHR